MVRLMLCLALAGAMSLGVAARAVAQPTGDPMPGHALGVAQVADASTREAPVDRVAPARGAPGPDDASPTQPALLHAISTGFAGNVLAGLLSGLVSGFMVLALAFWWKEHRLRRRFIFLEGRWQHLDKEHELVPGATTTLRYRSSATLHVSSDTRYGRWTGRVFMDENMPEHGGGTFQYDGKDESGLLTIVVQGRDLIHVFPQTLTHKTQKTDFYIWKRLGD